MFRSRAILCRILQGSLLMTVFAAAPACAQQSFEDVAGSWSGSGMMKPSDGARRDRTISRPMPKTHAPARMIATENAARELASLNDNDESMTRRPLRMEIWRTFYVAHLRSFSVSV